MQPHVLSDRLPEGLLGARMQHQLARLPTCVTSSLIVLSAGVCPWLREEGPMLPTPLKCGADLPG